VIGYHWCDIIVMNVHAPTEDKIDDIKDRFYEELEHVFDKFPKYPIDTHTHTHTHTQQAQQYNTRSHRSKTQHKAQYTHESRKSAPIEEDRCDSRIEMRRFNIFNIFNI
jgi:hypothetical protein